MPNVLIVCRANMCRSPMAEFLLRHHLEQSSISDWTVHSAGAAAVDGWPAAEGAVEALRELGLDLTAHRSRSVAQAMLDQADLVLFME